MAQPSGQGGRAKGITPRELEVVRLIAQGLSGREAARRLSRSPRTIENHLRSVYHKLGVRNRVELVCRAQELQLLEELPRERAAAELELKGRALELLAALDRRLAAAPSDRYLGELAMGLAEAFGVRWAGIERVPPGDEAIEVVACVADGAPCAPFTRARTGSASAEALAGGSAALYSGARERFPEDPVLRAFGAEAWVGVRLDDRRAGTVGTLWIMHDKPIGQELLPELVLRLLARRAAAELELANTLQRLPPAGPPPPDASVPNTPTTRA